MSTLHFSGTRAVDCPTHLVSFSLQMSELDLNVATVKPQARLASLTRGCHGGHEPLSPAFDLTEDCGAATLFTPRPQSKFRTSQSIMRLSKVLGDDKVVKRGFDILARMDATQIATWVL